MPKTKRQKLSLYELLEYFNMEEKAVKHMEVVRWGETSTKTSLLGISGLVSSTALRKIYSLEIGTPIEDIAD